MSDLAPWLTTAFLTGLLGGVHCLGMCGGIVTALHTRPGAAVIAVRPAALPLSGIHWAYHTGRLTSYAVAGAIAGMVGSAALLFGTVRPVQHAGYLIANGFLIALGLYLAGWWPGFAYIERGGKILWQRLAPYARRAWLGPPSWRQAYGAGLLWGWVPCGLIYTTLMTAMTTGSPERGALILFAFGLGTLPNLLFIGTAAQQLHRFMRQRIVRYIAGFIIISFGLWGLWHAHQIVQTEGGWFCTTEVGR